MVSERIEDIAWRVSGIAHFRQMDKSGRPYTKHLQSVQRRAMSIAARHALGVTELEAIACAALLHDTLEDTDLTEDAMRAAGIPERAISIVKAVTKPKGACYLEWIKSIATSGDVGAIIVKLADNLDNSDEARLALLPEADADRLRKKYAAAREILRVALEDERW